MKITTTQLLRATTVEEYTPEIAELHYWYSGTHAGIDPRNPYSRKRSRVRKTTYRVIPGGKGVIA